MGSAARMMGMSLVVTALILGSLELGLRWSGVVEDDAPQSILAFQRRTAQAVTPEGSTVLYRGSRARAARAAPVGKRVLLFGGSAALGSGYSPWVAFSGQAERWLNLSYDTPIEVISLGTGGAALRDVRKHVHDALTLGPRPDLIIVHSGNNEYHELRAHKEVDPRFDARTELVRRRLQTVHLYRLLRRWLPPLAEAAPAEGAGPRKAAPRITQLHATVDADERALVTLLYREELEALAKEVTAAGVPLLLTTVPTHLSHSPEITADIAPSPAEGDLIGTLRSAPDPRAALTAIEPKVTSMGGHLMLGQRLQERGMIEDARRHLLLAEAGDPRPVRADMHLRQAVRDVAERGAIPLCDLEAGIAALSGGIPEADVFDDACHPNRLGHYREGVLLSRCILDQRLLGAPDAPGWAASLDAALLAAPPDDPWRIDRLTERQLEEEDVRRLPEPTTAAEAARLGHMRLLVSDHAGAALAYQRALALGGPPAPLHLDLALNALYLNDLAASRAWFDEAPELLAAEPALADLRATLGP